jgi:ribosomal protein L11 methyltransferase
MHDEDIPAATIVARIGGGDEAWARRLADLIGESLDMSDVTVAAIVLATDRSWAVELGFRTAPDRADLHELVARLADPATADAMTFATVADRDWIAESLAGLSPVAAGRFVVHGQHDRGRIPLNRLGIEIEAALAFGTGHHGTTRGCLLALDRIARSSRPRRILDVGTGTGVLAIAAAKALRRPVVASDIDRRAVLTAHDNARANRVAPAVTAIHAGGLAARRLRAGGRYDLVLANILLGPLKRMAAPMVPLLAPDARVVLSGLLPSQANAALAAYRCAGLALERAIRLEGWITLVLRWRGWHGRA